LVIFVKLVAVHFFRSIPKNVCLVAGGCAYYRVAYSGLARYPPEQMANPKENGETPGISLLDLDKQN
jgi:hypothetical protein